LPKSDENTWGAAIPPPGELHGFPFDSVEVQILFPPAKLRRHSSFKTRHIIYALQLVVFVVYDTREGFDDRYVPDHLRTMCVEAIWYAGFSVYSCVPWMLTLHQ